MKVLAKELRGLKSPTTQTAFEALIDSIVEQQISLTIANMMEHRLTKQFGEKLNVDDNTYYSFPTAETLVAASLSDLRSCGLSQKKAEYIKEVSQKVIRGDLNFETEKIIRELDEIRGIGLWTAELTMIRGMRRFDAFPADDLGLRRVISHYYFSDKRITSDDARLVAKNWGPWKGLAGYYLIVASLKGITI
jgi:DNA-3-methyladenine glycosylase II